MWRPKIRRGGRGGRGRTRAGYDYAVTEAYRSWKAPKGVISPGRRDIAKAMDTIPADMGWDWSQPRLMPVLERPGSDRMPDDPYLRAIADCGIGYGFGLEIGPMFARVTRQMADGWERSDDTIRDVALANLRRRLADDAPGFEVPQEADDALVVRALSTPQGFATSVLLVPDALTRIFGDVDQIFTAPARPMLLAFAGDTPPEVVKLMTAEAERLDPHPLKLDPFRLTGGRLIWDGRATGRTRRDGPVQMS